MLSEFRLVCTKEEINQELAANTKRQSLTKKGNSPLLKIVGPNHYPLKDIVNPIDSIRLVDCISEVF